MVGSKKLYRKIGSEGWNGTTKQMVIILQKLLVEVIVLVQVLLFGFLTHQVSKTAMKTYKVGNAGASFLDSPNSTDTIYYTIYWASRIGNLPVNVVIFKSSSQRRPI